MTNTPLKLIALAGATASGKTSLAVNLAEQFNGEIVSVDSRQIYKELNISAAKPDISEQRGIKHHMIDIASITQEYTAANFYDDAEDVIQDIISRGKLPILAGGTGLYFRILLQDFDLPRSAPDKNLRAELDKFSSNELHEKLVKLDFETAVKIHPNNKVKIIRALEVCINTGSKMSKEQKKKIPRFSTLWLGLESEDREFLYERINRRVDKMFEKGLLNEAEYLFDNYRGCKLLNAVIGIKEFADYFKGAAELGNVSDMIKQNTRRYAKRQICWFKPNMEINRFDIKKQSEEEIKERSFEMLQNFLSAKEG